MCFCTGLSASNCSAGRQWDGEHGSFRVQWAKEKSRAQRLTHVRTEFTCNVLLPSMASKPAWEVGNQESTCVCFPMDWKVAWMLQEIS